MHFSITAQPLVDFTDYIANVIFPEIKIIVDNILNLS